MLKFLEVNLIQWFVILKVALFHMFQVVNWKHELQPGYNLGHAYSSSILRLWNKWRPSKWGSRPCPSHESRFDDSTWSKKKSCIVGRLTRTVIKASIKRRRGEWQYSRYVLHTYVPLAKSRHSNLKLFLCEGWHLTIAYQFQSSGRS